MYSGKVATATKVVNVSMAHGAGPPGQEVMLSDMKAVEEMRR